MKLPIYLIDSIGDPVVGATLTGAEVKTSVDGGALATAAGTTGAVGSGAYYYETAPADIAGTQLALYVKDAASLTYSITIRLPLQYDFPAGATGTVRRLPAFLVNTSNAPVTGANPTGAQLQVSIDGAAWANALGTWHELADGAYYYDPHATEIATAGLLVLRVAATGAVVYVYAVFVGGDGAAPTVDVITPDAAEQPGSPGAFPVDYATAKDTPIVIDLGDDAALVYVAVHHTQLDGSRKCVYRRGTIQVGYRSGSFQEVVSGKTRLHVLPDGGWVTGATGEVQLLPDLVDGAGNVNVET